MSVFVYELVRVAHIRAMASKMAALADAAGSGLMANKTRAVAGADGTVIPPTSTGDAGELLCYDEKPCYCSVARAAGVQYDEKPCVSAVARAAEEEHAKVKEGVAGSRERFTLVAATPSIAEVAETACTMPKWLDPNLELIHPSS